MKRKCFAIGIILLSIGVTFSPGINVSIVKASQDNNLVEITTEICGIKGNRSTSVKLSREQYQNLEQYLINFRVRLNQSSTRGEAMLLFKEAVVELDNFGLLPTRISLVQASTLVFPSYYNEKLMKFGGKPNKESYLFSDNTSNALCLFVGQTTETRFLSLSSRVSIVLFLVLSALAEKVGSLGYKKLGFLLLGFGFPLFIHFGLSFFLGNISPISVFQWIRFGSWVSRPGYVNPAEGWIFTFGAQGKKSWNQTFHGAMTQDSELNIGAIGFTGIKLCIPHLDYVSILYTTFFLGSALLVNIEKIS
jgi:hypothetical protein